MRVEPDDCEPLVARGEPLDRADVRAAAAAEDERPLGRSAATRERLLAERGSTTTFDLREGEREFAAASAIASPPRPQARGTRTSPAPKTRPQA